MPKQDHWARVPGYLLYEEGHAVLLRKRAPSLQAMPSFWLLVAAGKDLLVNFRLSISLVGFEDLKQIEETRDLNSSLLA